MTDRKIAPVRHTQSMQFLFLLGLLIFLLPVGKINGQQVEEISQIEITDISGAVYVSAWRVEKEIIFKPLALQNFIDLGISEQSSITPDKREEIKNAVAALNSEFLQIKIDAEEVDFTLEGVRFLEPRPDQSVPISETSVIGVNDFVISIVTSTPLPKLESSLELNWKRFHSNQNEIPIRVADMIGSTLYKATKERSQLTIKPRMAVNARDLPEAPEAPSAAPAKIPFSAFLLSLIGIILIISGLKSSENKGKKMIAGVVSFLLAIIVALALGRQQKINMPEIAQEEAKDMADRLLEGVYHSFNFEEEEMQYDVLSQVAGSQALTDIYLEIRRTLAKREADGARVRVLNVNVTDAQPEKLSNSVGYLINCTWKAFGEVGHWGHFHRRNNRYAAKLRIEVIDGKWKLTSLSNIEREREINANAEKK